ncbi:class I SAM-dependent methyltransferase, partial [Goekera deserti]|uniref:class I SAM-dependent methyltransferase n=1 Tax=Goekera deserti TaxID=2497753 RepID=UPI001575244E
MPPPAAAAPTAEQFPARTAAIWAALDPLVAAGRPLQVLDVGGGSGIFAVPLAELGHQVTVVDTSADALATLARRAGNAGVADRVRALQGDADRLGGVLPAAGGTGSFDLVLCHFLLEVVDDPHRTLQEIAGVLRPGAPVSVAGANRAGAVLARALSGHPVEARALIDDRDPAPGRARPARRRFTPDELLGLVRAAGLQPGPWRGVSVVADPL